MIEISHHGATAGVTGSCHELTLGHGENRAGILVDCGLFQGEEKRSAASDLAIDFPIGHIRALIVTHVHIDHVGRIPYLLAAGFAGPIICSEPTAIMLPEILEDALKIGFTRDRALIERVLGLIRTRLVPVAYGEWHSVFAEADYSLSVRLQPAGHILGSAYVECQAKAKDSRPGIAGGWQDERIVFSGDLGAPHSPLLPEATPPERADRLVIESTYGDKDHEDRQTRRYRLKTILERALADGGTVLVPAFSIGRTQELLYEIESLIDEFGDQVLEVGSDSEAGANKGSDPTGSDPNFGSASELKSNRGSDPMGSDPVFTSQPKAGSFTWKDLQFIVDSPLAANFTSIYRSLKPFWDAEALERVAQGRHPLSFEQLTVIDSHEDHLNAVDYLASSHRPCVVLAGSGMCAGGRIVNYLKAMLGDACNDILFVGYQAAGTPGRDILAHGPGGGWVELDGSRYNIRARVHQVGGYSAHAGQSDLVRFVKGIPAAPGEIRIVHGDTGAKQALKRCFQSFLTTDIMIPKG